MDREAKPTRSIRIQVKDSGGLTYEQAFTITIDNANDAPDRVLLGSISLDENLPADSVVTTLGALDPDNDVGDTHTFSLIEGKGGDDNTSFYIDGNELKATAPFDYETKSEYKFDSATDAAGLRGYGSHHIHFGCQ